MKRALIPAVIRSCFRCFHRQLDLEAVDSLLTAVESFGRARLASVPEAEHPLVQRLAKRYQLSAAETDLLQVNHQDLVSASSNLPFLGDDEALEG
jgi:hypothetical protein